MTCICAPGTLYQADAGRTHCGRRPDRRGRYLPSLFVSNLVDLFVDGVIIGLGSTQNLVTGLVMALGMALSTAPLAFVTIATTKRQRALAGYWRLLGRMFVVALMAGALLGCLVLQNQPLELRMVLVALASGFLITTVVEGIIP
jgi:zinc transporter, ZIP family